MQFNFFASLFNKQTKKLTLSSLDSILLKNIKNLSIKNNFILYQDITVYHHNLSMSIPLLALDPTRGIYIFEHKEWNFHDLDKAELKKSSDNISNFILTKFNEILHNDGVALSTFLLTQNLSYEDYQHLAQNKQDILPYEKIIFSDSDEKKILSKLYNALNTNFNMPPKDFILANLFTQYLIYDNPTKIHFASQEQIAFIDNEDYTKEVIYGHTQSGKTTALLLKAILLKLKYPMQNITLIKPTTLSCDKLKVQLLNIIEYTIVDIDITSISIITPEQFKSLKKISKYVLCDDTNLLDDDFLTYLYSKTHKSHLSLVNAKEEIELVFKLTQNFHLTKAKIEFINANPIAMAMQLISEHTSVKSDLSILCISSEKNKVNLDEDLKFFIKDKAVLLDSSKSLIDQENSHIILSDYDNINAHTADIVLLLDIDEISEDKLAYAVNLANDKVYIVYMNECQKITNLKKIFIS